MPGGATTSASASPSTIDFETSCSAWCACCARTEASARRCAARFRYVLVDEYQDTNGPQYEIVRRIAEAHRNLCVVGDDDQSIYGWRGADIRNILDFERDFPGAAVVRLETNYRSTNQILKAANAVIRNNAGRHEKTLRSALGDGPPVRIAELEDEEHEAEFVVQDILKAVQTGRGALEGRGDPVPHPGAAARLRGSAPREPGAVRPHRRSVLLRPQGGPRPPRLPEAHGQSGRRAVPPAHRERAPRGVGDTTVERVLAFATREGIHAGEAFERAGGLEGVPPAAVEAVRGLRRTLADLGHRADGPRLAEAVRELVRAVDYRAEIDRSYPDPLAREARWAAVEEVVNFAENYSRGRPDPTLAGFLEEVTLSAEDRDESRKDAPRDAVTLMTLHAAKGLEFPRVYLVGVEEGLLPHQRSIDEDTVEEERRIMYVGVTRAQMHLTISHVRSRAKYGRRVPCRKSRFIHELKGEGPPG